MKLTDILYYLFYALAIPFYALWQLIKKLLS